MRVLLSKLCAGALAASVALGGSVAGAAPIHAPRTVSEAPQTSPLVQRVQLLDEERNRAERQQRRMERFRGNRGWDRDRRARGWDGRGDRGGRWDRRDSRADVRYYRGHRGFRDRRPGYRQHNGWWFPAAAFVTGAIVGGAIASEPPIRYRPRGNAHVDWCYDRYRSYRASDNTFQPYNGPRRQCRSPYG